jgi:hypothetical protein
MSATITDSVGDTHDLKIFGIPQDIALVLAIDAVLISLRVSNLLNTNTFIGAKVLGTTALIASHFVI